MPHNTQLYVAFASLLVAISNGLDRAYWFSLFDVDITEDNKADEDHRNPPGHACKRVSSINCFGVDDIEMRTVNKALMEGMIGLPWIY